MDPLPSPGKETQIPTQPPRKKWRLVFILFLELTILAGAVGALCLLGLIRNDSLGHWCTGLTLLFAALSLNAYLAD